MPDLSRRKFLQASALAATTVVVSGCTVDLQRTEHLESYVRPPEEGLPGDNLWFASTCRQCSAGCGIIVRVSNGRARKIEGNPHHPLNQGKLCARGQAALQELYDPDRLRNAVRQADRGTLAFQPLYWEDALAELSGRLRSVDAGEIALILGNPSSHLWNVASRFADALGMRPPLAYTFGDELTGQPSLLQASAVLLGEAAQPVYDIANAEAVFSFGANFLETWISPVYYSRAYSRMRRGPLGKRGYVVQFEPRLSSTAVSADEWVRIRPGTEGLVASGLGKILVDKGLLGATALAGFYEGVSVAEVAEASGVPAEELERLAGIFAEVASPVAIAGGGVTAHTGGIEAATAVHALNLLAGQVGQPGGVYLPPAPADDVFAPPPLSSFAEVQQLIDDMRAGRVKLLLVHGANPAFELPAASGFDSALAGVPYVVSFSSTVDETAARASLVLPDHTNLEAWGYHVPPVADRMLISGQQPVMRPLYDTRSTVDVFLALAQEFGGAVSEALPWTNEVDMLQTVLDAFRGQNVAPGAFWAEWRRRGGQWADAPEWRAPAASGAFGQPLSTQQLMPRLGGDESAHPLHLYPSITLFDGRGANKAWLQETPDPVTTVSWQTWIEIEPHTAEELGLEDGDVVRVISMATEVEAIVYLQPGLQEGVLAMPVGRGHEHYGRFAKGYGSNPIQLLAAIVDEDTGGLAWGATQVRIEPVGRQQELARLESDAGIAYMREEH
ncbi:MAG: molybdopterin-dependent oxidoreductase [Anaerolineae bacterium]|jgi:anaerobic selenocysteine-containing dehydrogenase